MSLSFLPKRIERALSHLNFNYVTEIRLRRGQPVIIGYYGEYQYLGDSGISPTNLSAIIVEDIDAVVNAATEGCLYNYTEQMKNGFITVGHGVRIGIAGEYVIQNGNVQAVRCITSLNIRIPHDIVGCADYICKNLFHMSVQSILIFSKPGLGKTTTLRDMVRFINKNFDKNVLVFDERGEISAMDGYGNGFNLGERVDVIRCNNKLGAISSAIRAMKPDVIITDELYGEEDVAAVRFAYECGICIIASSHIIDRQKLIDMPFEYFVGLTKLGGQPEIYDKNFNPYCPCRIDNFNRSISFGK